MKQKPERTTFRSDTLLRRKMLQAPKRELRSVDSTNALLGYKIHVGLQSFPPHPDPKVVHVP